MKLEEKLSQASREYNEAVKLREHWRAEVNKIEGRISVYREMLDEKISAKKKIIKKNDGQQRD